MPDITDADERAMLAAVKAATDHVEAGLSPDEAVEKVARDYNLGPGKIRLVGQAVNTGQQLGQWRSGAGGVLAKLAAFPLCDPQRVIDAVHGVTPAAEKASADYSRPPTWARTERTAAREKAAAYALPAAAAAAPATPSAGRLFGVADRAKHAWDEARRRAAAAEDSVRTKVASLVSYFRQLPAARLPFADVDAAAAAYYGAGGAALMGVVHKQANSKEKRAAAARVLSAPLDLGAAPFTLVAAAVAAAGECAAQREKAAAARAAYAAAREAAYRPFAPAGEAGAAPAGPWAKEAAAVFGVEKAAFGFGTEVAAIAAGDILAHKATHGDEDPDPYGDVSSLDSELAEVRRQAAAAKAEKKAYIGGALAAGIGAGMSRTVGSMGKTKDDLVNDEWMKLEDPEHDNELRKIRAHAMLTQLMTDPDDPISGHDPDSVLRAYNEIASATPRVAETAATLRPALRKRLEGHQEPFEAKELLDIEKGLAQSRLPTPNTSILSETPEKLLG